MAFTAGFGGVGWSGQGKIKGYEGFKDCSHKKVIVERGTSDFLDLDHRYREHENSKKLMNHIFRISKGRTIEPYMRIGKVIIGITLIMMFIHQLFSKKILILNLK